MVDDFLDDDVHRGVGGDGVASSAEPERLEDATPLVLERVHLHEAPRREPQQLAHLTVHVLRDERAGSEACVGGCTGMCQRSMRAFERARFPVLVRTASTKYSGMRL